MKKIGVIFSLVLALLSINTYGVEIDSTSVSGKNSEFAFDSAVYADGKEVLKNITVGTGNVLGTGYDIIIKQQILYSVQYSLVGLLCLVFAYLFFRFYAKAATNKNILFPAIIFLVGMVWTAIVFSLHFEQILQGFINPDYAAIKEIVVMFKTASGK